MAGGGPPAVRSVRGGRLGWHRDLPGLTLLAQVGKFRPVRPESVLNRPRAGNRLPPGDTGSQGDAAALPWAGIRCPFRASPWSPCGGPDSAGFVGAVCGAEVCVDGSRSLGGEPRGGEGGRATPSRCRHLPPRNAPFGGDRAVFGAGLHPRRQTHRGRCCSSCRRVCGTPRRCPRSQPVRR